MKKSNHDETNGASGEVRHFYYNQQWQVIEERVGGSSSADKQYVYHPHYVDAIAMRYDAGSTDEHYFLQDANFNVTAVVDETGAVEERYAYTPYGEVTVLDDVFATVSGNVSAISNEHLYTGRRRDPETGLQLNRSRFYAAGLGRWVNRDPIGYYSGFNLYSYVLGMPTYYVDPSGLLPPPDRFPGLQPMGPFEPLDDPYAPDAPSDCEQYVDSIIDAINANNGNVSDIGDDFANHNIPRPPGLFGFDPVLTGDGTQGNEMFGHIDYTVGSNLSGTGIGALVQLPPTDLNLWLAACWVLAIPQKKMPLRSRMTWQAQVCLTQSGCTAYHQIRTRKMIFETN